jgi:hypothetical protein
VEKGGKDVGKGGKEEGQSNSRLSSSICGLAELCVEGRAAGGGRGREGGKEGQKEGTEGRSTHVARQMDLVWLSLGRAGLRRVRGGRERERVGGSLRCSSKELRLALGFDFIPESAEGE